MMMNVCSMPPLPAPSQYDEAKCNLGKVKLKSMQYRTSGVAHGIWQGFPWLRLQLHFTPFVCHRALANHCGFTLMLYHESSRDYAKASVANLGRYWPSSDGEALWNLAPTPPTLLAGCGLGK